jgi:arsenate reductase-like glutaredoxin family protein
MSCQRAQGFLETVGGTVTTVQDAKKVRVEPADALKLARTMDKVIAAKGKKVVAFDLKADPPDDQTLLDHLIGPSGFLRAPTAIVGRTLMVGFNEEMYRQLLGD